MRIRSAAPLFVSLVTLVSLATPARAGAVRTELVSRFQGVDAIQGHSSTYSGQMVSDNGRFVAFSVDDDDLPGADGTRDIYVRDRGRGRTRLVSRNSAGDPAEGNSSDSLAISRNGRFVAFSVNADNLPGEPGLEEVYVHDMDTRKTRLVSKTSAGQPADDSSVSPSLSANGRYVAFASDADNLPGDDAYTDVYVHDRKTGRTRLVSKTSGGVPANDASNYPSLSGDGSRVAFWSSADNLPGDDAYRDIYVHDLDTRKTLLVSRTSSGVPANGNSTLFAGSMSPGGRFVGFESSADNLGGAPGFLDVFRHDRRTGRTRLMSRSTSGAPGDEDSFYAAISADGRFVAFTSRANNFSGADDNTVSNAFIRGPLG